MTTARDVANYFLTLSQPEEGDEVSNLKLQKLCYYAQGFALALLDRPLFGERIEAWEHGPVVPPLYQSFKEYGSGGIPIPSDFDAGAFKAEESDIVREVWDVYGQFSAWKLRNMTHEEPPWASTPRNQTISHDSLRQFFRTRCLALAPASAP